MWRNLKLLHTQISRAYKSEISPHDKFFSTCMAGDTGDKYQVWGGGSDIWELFPNNPVFFSPMTLIITSPKAAYGTASYGGSIEGAQ